MLYDNIKDFIEYNIGLDNDISTEISIKPQYKYGETAKPPEILIYFADDTENEFATTFEGENVSTVLLQIIVMANSMPFGGIKYNAQKSCNILTEKLKNIFEKSNVINNIEDIINVRRVQKSDSQPYEVGTTTYYSILRFELQVINKL